MHAPLLPHVIHLAHDGQRLCMWHHRRLQQSSLHAAPALLHLILIACHHVGGPAMAFHKLVVITRALNEGWRPDWSNTNQPKWFNWWWTNGNAGLACANLTDAPSYTDATVGSRLCFKSEALADYAAETFKELYEDYLMFK